MDARSEKSTKIRSAHDDRSTWRARAWRYGPVLFWMGVIFFASTGNLSASNTSRIIRPLLLWIFPDITEGGLLYAHFLIRKGAHLSEYAVLALLAARAFLTSSHVTLRRWWIAFAFGLVAVCALLDEYHQSFLDSRTGTPYDSILDMTGGAIALALLLFVLTLRRKKRARRLLRDAG